MSDFCTILFKFLNFPASFLETFLKILNFQSSICITFSLNFRSIFLLKISLKCFKLFIEKFPKNICFEETQENFKKILGKIFRNYGNRSNFLNILKRFSTANRCVLKNFKFLPDWTQSEQLKNIFHIKFTIIRDYYRIISIKFKRIRYEITHFYNN